VGKKKFIKGLFYIATLLCIPSGVALIVTMAIFIGGGRLSETPEAFITLEWSVALLLAGLILLMITKIFEDR